MRDFCAFPEQLAQAAQDVADLLDGDLGLDAVDELVHQIVGQIHAHQLLDDSHGVLVELIEQRLVAHELGNDLLDLCLDVHNIPSGGLNLQIQCTTAGEGCQIVV